MNDDTSPFKSRSGLVRILRAARYSWRGLRAAVRHEAAFRQELLLGLPLLLAAPWVGRSLTEVLLLAGSVVLVWVVELLNSALEALADEIALERRERLGRAKDLGSAAVMLALLLAAATWGAVLVARLAS
ncbi:MAG: diacylglycerol kinase [Ideonella sp.]|nr:diacylglycerol kinase [Ideonella sp.]